MRLDANRYSPIVNASATAIGILIYLARISLYICGVFGIGIRAIGSHIDTHQSALKPSDWFASIWAIIILVDLVSLCYIFSKCIQGIPYSYLYYILGSHFLYECATISWTLAASAGIAHLVNISVVFMIIFSVIMLKFSEREAARQMFRVTVPAPPPPPVAPLAKPLTSQDLLAPVIPPTHPSATAAAAAAAGAVGSPPPPLPRGKGLFSRIVTILTVTAWGRLRVGWAVGGASITAGQFIHMLAMRYFAEDFTRTPIHDPIYNLVLAELCLSIAAVIIFTVAGCGLAFVHRDPLSPLTILVGVVAFASRAAQKADAVPSQDVCSRWLLMYYVDVGCSVFVSVTIIVNTVRAWLYLRAPKGMVALALTDERAAEAVL